MAMERFARGKSRGATVAFRAQYVTLSTGLIGLMGKPESVNFYYDETSGEVGIEKGRDYRVSYKDGWGGGIVTASAYIRRHGLSGKKFEKGGELDGIVVFKEQNGLSK